MTIDIGRSGGTRELLAQVGREVTRVVQARLRVDARLLLECRNRERAMDEDERCDHGRDQPRVVCPEEREHAAEAREDQVRRQALDREQAGLTEAVPAAELEHHAQQHVVERDVDSRGGERRHRD